MEAEDPEGQETVDVALLGLSSSGAMQLLSLLSQHPAVRLTHVADTQLAGKRLADLADVTSFLGDRPPALLQDSPLEIQPIQPAPTLAACSIVFTALGHGVAHRLVPSLLEAGQRVIDLSADYRFKDLKVYRACYGLERSDQKLVNRALYGLPELYPHRFSQASLVAGAGCYSTASLLAIAPLLKRGLIQPETLIIDAKMGSSGLGQELIAQSRSIEMDNSVAAYNVACHRQTPEIEQICRELLGHEVMVQFTPHLVPMARGLLSTVYATLRDPGLVREDLRTIYRAFYQRSPSVHILPSQTYPQTRSTLGTNRCDIGIEVDDRTGRVIVMGAIDNLIKGGAGQAVQCLNLMMGWDELLGL